MVEEPKKPLVTIYTGKDCCLCKEAKKVIEGLLQEMPFSFIEIDIASNKEIMDRFKEDIPVIFINDRKAFKYRVDKESLIAKLYRV